MKITDFIHIESSDIIYEVNEDKKTVSARVMNIGLADCENTASEIALAVYGMDIVNVPNKFVAVARCSDADEFDAEKGKIIARLKLLRKVKQHEYNCIQKLIDQYTADYNKAMACLEKYKDVYGKGVENIDRYIANSDK